MKLYIILGVEVTATAQQIKKAYYAKSKVHHPDAGGDAEMFKELVLAYAILSDTEKRKRYDAGEDADEITKQTQTLDQIVVQTVTQAFCQIVMGADVENQDLVAIMREHFTGAVVQTTHAMNAENQKIRKFQTALKRIKAEGEENIFVSSANAQIAGLKAQIERIQQQKAVAEGAVKFLEAYSYAVDQHVMQVMMGHSGTTFTFHRG